VPLSVRTPVPVLVKASVPLLFWMLPANTLVALPLPTVNVGVPPPELSTVPLPLRPSIVSLNPPISSVPLSVTLPAPATSVISLPPACFSVPALIVVAPT